MDKFEQLTAYFRAVSDLHKYRHIPLATTLALLKTLPEFAETLTSPVLRARMAIVLSTNAPLLVKASA